MTTELAGRHVLLGVSGGVAAYKAAALARGLVKAGASVQAILTRAGAEFVGPATFEAITGRPAHTAVFTDVHQILHVRLAREADVAVFAPATANLIAKLAHGIADDLVTSTYTCLRCPAIVAPAMHTEMWEHPATVENVATLRRHGVQIVGPDTGELAGGDVGPGRLVEEDVLLDAVRRAVVPDSRLRGRRVVVTAGGTREPIDPVRFIGNHSSGKMGYALAAEAVRRGAHVDLVSGPTALPDPPGAVVHRVETAAQMRDAVIDVADKAEVVVKAAAVADYRPADVSATKLKKEEVDLAQIRLERTSDILAELGAAKDGRILVGFAAETDMAEERGKAKLDAKGLDLIVVNTVGVPDAGFDVDTNRALVLGADGARSEVPLVTKAELAAVVWDHVEALLGDA